MLSFLEKILCFPASGPLHLLLPLSGISIFPTSKSFLLSLPTYMMLIFQMCTQHLLQRSLTQYSSHVRSHWKCYSLSHVWLFAPPLTVACQAPLFMEFSRQAYWSGLPFPSPGDLPYSLTEPRSLVLQADSLAFEPPGKPLGPIICSHYTLYDDCNYLLHVYFILCWEECSMRTVNLLVLLSTAWGS